MDKIVIKFFTDLLYCKGIVFFDEYEAIMDAKTPQDLDIIIDRVLRSDFNGYKRGEVISSFDGGKSRNNPPHS